MGSDDRSGGQREGILLVALQVVTMTYGAGLNPPGGIWADTKDDHLTGNPILDLTYHVRYSVFSSSNTTALMASAAVVLLLLFVRGKKSSRRLWFVTVLRTVVSLGMVALAVAYAAGASRNKFTTKYAYASVGLLSLFVVIMILVWIKTARKGKAGLMPSLSRYTVSAIFVASMTYTAALSPPGGFWLDTKDGHRAGDPALPVHYRRRFTAFFVGNTMAFVASLFMIPLLLTNIDVDDEGGIRYGSLLCIYNILGYVQQGGLTVAYAAGSNKDMVYLAYVLLGGLGFVPGMVLILVMIPSFIWLPISRVVKEWFSRCVKRADEEPEGIEPFFVYLFTTFSATVTYQAGLNPPGGLWQDNLDGHNAGSPILLAKQPTRYRVFMYCNSMALVASLVAIIMCMTRKCQQQRTRALNGLLVLDLISLIGAYAAGCCRDVQTSIYVIALGGAVVVYVVFHMAFLMSKDKLREDDQKSEWSRDLMLGILGATLTYQTGLTPPGGFWQSDDEFGHHAGEPVLLSTYPNRYTVFFYLNALCFMASIFLTVFFVNRHLYEAAIRCHALFICVLAVFFGLIGAYAAGSYRSLEPSICMIVLGAAVFIFITAVLLLFCKLGDKGEQDDQEDIDSQEGNNQEGNNQEGLPEDKTEMLKYLVLIGSIGATVTYQAGFAPPRSFWPDDSNGHAVGNPVLRDMNPLLYCLYFVCNTTAFLASSCIMYYGPGMVWRLMKKRREISYSVLRAPTVLFAMGILGAYAAGSTSGWNSNSTYVVALVAPVLFFTFVIDHVVKLIRNKHLTRYMEAIAQ